MSFHWPYLLWLLVLPGGLLIAELTRRVRAVTVRHPKILRAEASPSGLSLNRGKQTSSAMPRVRWRFWLGLMLVVTAFARPQWGEVETEVFEQSREILIGVDLSKSMLAADVVPTRLERAKLLITGLLEQLEGERVGLAVFAGTSFLQSPLSADYEILQEFLPALDPDFLPAGGTEYVALLNTALDSFSSDSSADRFLIILSDGESQTEEWRSRVEQLKERSIRVISLGIGTTEGSMLPDSQGGFIKDERGAVVLSRLNPSTLEELARTTSGVYRDASAWVDLAEVVEQTVEAGLAGEFAESRRTQRIERFQWTLGPALLLMLWSLWREFPVRPRTRAVTIDRNRAATGVAGIILWTGLAALDPAPVSAQQPMEAPSPEAMALQFEAPLSELLSRLSAQGDVAASEFATVAEETITWGNQILQVGQAPHIPVVTDALAAIDLGEVIDPDAADWPTLREELEKLLEESQDQQQQDQENEGNEDQEDESENEEVSEGDENEDEGQEGEQENEDQSGESGEDQDGEGEGEPNESESPDGEPSEEDESSGEGSPEQEEPSQEERENAFDDFDDPAAESEEGEVPPPEPQEPQQQPGTQSVGGQPLQNQEAEQNPELVVPLQKLDQLKDQDSPAQLFQLMQDPNAQPPKSGRDW